MNSRLIAAFAVLIVGVALCAPDARAAKTGAQKSPRGKVEENAEGGDQLDRILSLPANIAPVDSSSTELPVDSPPAKDTRDGAPSEPTPRADSTSSSSVGTSGEVAPTDDNARAPKASSASMPDPVQSINGTPTIDTAKSPKGTKVGVGGPYPNLIQQTPKADLVGAEDADPKLLRGNVSDTGAINPLLKPILPELDCMGFAAHANEAAIKFLKSQIAKGNGYLTDGGAWARSGDYPFMSIVYEGDSCDKAGIEVGDIMLELNGVSLYRVSDETVNNACALYDGNLRNHFVLKRGDRVFRVTTQCWWHSFGSGSSEEKLWKDTVHRFAKQL